MDLSVDKYHFSYIDEFGDVHEVTYKVNEYDSLMILLFDQYGEDWGDCKGRAWCGTCRIEILSGSLQDTIDPQERDTLSKLPRHAASNRLACQIPADEHLSGITFKILKDE